MVRIRNRGIKERFGNMRTLVERINRNFLESLRHVKRADERRSTKRIYRGTVDRNRGTVDRNRGSRKR